MPTMDTARYKYQVELCIRSKLPCLIVGTTGTGKSAYVQDLLMNGLGEDYVAFFQARVSREIEMERSRSATYGKGRQLTSLILEYKRCQTVN